MGMMLWGWEKDREDEERLKNKECTTFIPKNIKIGIAGEEIKIGDAVMIKDGKLFRAIND